LCFNQYFISISLKNKRVPCDIKHAYISKVRGPKDSIQCNSIRISTTSYGVKFKRRGIQLMLASGSFIVDYRETYDSKSITDVANMYLVVLFKSIIFYFNKYYLYCSLYKCVCIYHRANSKIYDDAHHTVVNMFPKIIPW
jgi:hypothetical protein